MLKFTSNLHNSCFTVFASTAKWQGGHYVEAKMISLEEKFPLIFYYTRVFASLSQSSAPKGRWREVTRRARLRSPSLPPPIRAIPCSHMIDRLPDLTLKTEQGPTQWALQMGLNNVSQMVSEAARLLSITESAGITQHMSFKNNAEGFFFSSQDRIRKLERSQG